MKKIAVLTWFNGSANYGQTLQAYALNATLKKYKYEGVFINYDNGTRDYYYDKNKNVLIRILSKTKYFNLWVKWISKEFSFARYKKFDRFINKYLLVTKPALNKSAIAETIMKYGCEKIICGSDQIWNPNYDPSEDVFFCNIPELWKFKKIAYAPSIGVGFVEEHLKKSFTNSSRLIHDFEHISVREESGKELIKKYWQEIGLADKPIECVLDPAFLLAAEEWKSIIKPCKYTKYILCYFVGNHKQNMHLVESIADSLSIPVIVVGMDQDYQVVSEKIKIIHDLGPEEFLGLIKNADYVLGDSYHAAVFSIIFSKEFAFFKRNDECWSGYEYDDRLNNLLKTFQLESRYINTYDDYLKLNKIDYKKVEEILHKKREMSFEYLRTALES